MSDLQSFFSRFVTDHLDTYQAVPKTFNDIIDRAVFGLLDSEILIEDNFSVKPPLVPPKVGQPLPEFEQTYVIDQLTNQIKTDGFGPHFHNIIGLFGSIMLQMTATPEQQQQVNDWLEQGHFGHFLMTDAGGPSLNHWDTKLDNSSAQWTIAINKKWGIEAHQLGFLMLVVKQPGKPFPLTFLVPPDQAQHLEQHKVGVSYLDGRLQLGNVKGTINVDASQQLKLGGLSSVNRFLTLVRPRFVKALMNHMLWLASQERLAMDETLHEHIQYLHKVADGCLANKSFSIHSVDQVLALKFASNELLFDTVAQGKVCHFSDQRDLLGFTKMEGSSYRCFLEIYSKQKRARQ